MNFHGFIFPQGPPGLDGPKGDVGNPGEQVKFLNPKRNNDMTLCPFLRYSVINFYHIISIVSNIFDLVIVSLTSFCGVSGYPRTNGIPGRRRTPGRQGR